MLRRQKESQVAALTTSFQGKDVAQNVSTAGIEPVSPVSMDDDLTIAPDQPSIIAVNVGSKELSEVTRSDEWSTDDDSRILETMRTIAMETEC